MSNNLVNQSTKAISTNELRWIGPVLAVVSSGPMDLFFFFWYRILSDKLRKALKSTEIFLKIINRIMKSMVAGWIRDVTTYQNVFADHQIIHFYR